MSITVYLGYWEGKLTLSPHPDDDATFRAMGRLAMVSEDRTVLFVQDDDGAEPQDIDPDRNGGLLTKYEWADDNIDMARFMRHEVELSVDDDGHMVTWVDADHQLPWPKLQSYGGLDLREVAHREFERRARSAYEGQDENNLLAFTRSVPDRFRQHIDKGFWAGVINKVRVEGRQVYH